MTVKSLCASAAFGLLSIFGVTSYASTAYGWASVDHSDMIAMKRDVFSVYSDQGDNFKMRLVRVDAASDQGERPEGLARPKSFSALYVAPSADMQRLLESGQRTVWIYHPELGSAQIYIGAFAREDGVMFIEAVFG